MAWVKRAASVVTGVQGLWIFYLEFVRMTTAYNCPTNPAQYPCSAGAAPPIAGIVLAVLLIADAGLEFRGSWLAFPAGVVLSAGGLMLMVLGSNSSYSITNSYVGAALGVLTIVLVAVALRRRAKMPEQGNPMNLPVFG